MNTTSNYPEVYESWKTDPEGFWAKAAAGLSWYKPCDKVFDPDMGIYGRWFVGAECNTCYNAIDRHVENGLSDQAAIIYDSPVTDVKTTYSYAELKSEVESLAAVLRSRGIKKGDRVLIYMPMVPQAAFAMLATARLGAVHTVVFGGFAPTELAVRINDCTPKAIISTSCGIEPNRVIAYKPLLDEAIEISDHKPDTCIIHQREQQACELIDGRDVDYASATAAEKAAGTEVPCVPVAATDPLYILYTSGTTGTPKGVVRDNGGHMVALHWSMSAIYDIKPGEVFWAASDVGWVVGHSYIVYGPLLKGATTIIFEGKPIGTPDPGTFWRVVEEYKVAALFTAPTALRAIKKEDNDGDYLKKYDVSSMRSLFLAGERADPDTIVWAQNLLKVPVIDHWWQTETGWAIAGNPIGLGALPVKLGSPTVAMPGYDIQIVDEAGEPVEAGGFGNVIIKLPMPPGCLPSLWNADDRFHSAYLERFPGFYETSDAGLMDEDGYLFIMARTDDIINVAGHRLSTGGMEEVLSAHPDVAECAVVGIADKLKGQLPCGFIILRTNAEKTPEEIEQDCVKLVREKIGAVAAFKLCLTVPRLPKTRSGKILRGTIRTIVDTDDFKVPATIDDPAILDEIISAIKKRGIR